MKKFLALVLTLALCLGLTVPALALSKPTITEAGVGSFDVNLMENIYPYIQYTSDSPATVTMTATVNGSPLAASEITVTENSSNYYSCKFPARVEGTYTVQFTVKNAGGSVSTPEYVIHSSLKSRPQHSEPPAPTQAPAVSKQYTVTIQCFLDGENFSTGRIPVDGGGSTAFDLRAERGDIPTFVVVEGGVWDKAYTLTFDDVRSDVTAYVYYETPQEETPETGSHTLTINYYIDDKLVFTDHSPDGTSEAAYIYEIPESYHRYSFWCSSTNSGIGVFRTELWIAEQSSDGVVDLYANSDGSTPSQFLPPEPSSYEVIVRSLGEDGTVLNEESIFVIEGDKCYTRPVEYNGYTLTASYSDYSNGAFDPAIGLYCVPAVYYNGTITLVYSKVHSTPEPPSQPSGSLSNFRQVNVYYAGTFHDVSASDWFDENVSRAYELGLMKGVSGDSFDPKSSVTVAEAITLAARLHSIYYTGTESFVQSGNNWYDVYVSYARDNNILQGSFYHYTAPISREDFVLILANTLPERALPDILDGSIYFDDLKRNGNEIYLLARAGIIRGVPNAFGTLDFQPDKGISRAEVAAIVTRMADPSLRQ